MSQTALVPIDLRAEAEFAANLASQDLAKSTQINYLKDLQSLQSWCAARAIDILHVTPHQISMHIGHEVARGIKPASLARKVAAIKYAFEARDMASPTSAKIVQRTIAGAMRTLGVAPSQKKPLVKDDLLAVLDAFDDDSSLLAARDRALLCLGFGGALRRSEIVALNVEDVETVPSGMRVHIRRSKTDQEGRGAVITLLRGHARCPVATLETWLERARIDSGAMFRSFYKGDRVSPTRLTHASVALVLKKRLLAAGIDPTHYSGHSLRSGFVTTAITNGRNIFKVMDITRHKSVNTLKGYVRRADEFKDHAAEGMF